MIKRHAAPAWWDLHARLPFALRAMVTERAAAAGRSVNAEIVSLVMKGLGVKRLDQIAGGARTRMGSTRTG